MIVMIMVMIVMIMVMIVMMMIDECDDNGDDFRAIEIRWFTKNSLLVDWSGLSRDMRFLAYFFCLFNCGREFFLRRILGVFCSKISCMLAGRVGLPGRGRQLWMGGAREDAVQVIRKTIQVPPQKKGILKR